MEICVNHLSKKFGKSNEVTGVRGVSFRAPERCITSLLGPSGSGKSTLLRLVAGLEVPDEGSVTIAGEEVTNVPVRKRDVGFVFQNYALFNHMTVAENVAFGLEVRGAQKKVAAARVAELLELVQLGAYAKRFPSQLSGGQRQRVALARALAPNPRVLLLDEPFGALDTRVRLELREWLHALHEQVPVTTLLVTHDQEEALELSEHIVVLRDGTVAQEGSPLELYEHPKDSFVAAFLSGARVLKGRVFEGHWTSDSRGLDAKVGLEDGFAEAIVRPGDIRISKSPSDTQAQVERVLVVGGRVKLVVRLPGGDRLNVEMARRDLATSGIHRGDNVILDLRDVRFRQVAN